MVFPFLAPSTLTSNDTTKTKCRNLEIFCIFGKNAHNKATKEANIKIKEEVFLTFPRIKQTGREEQEYISFLTNIKRLLNQGLVLFILCSGLIFHDRP